MMVYVACLLAGMFIGTLLSKRTISTLQEGVVDLQNQLREAKKAPMNWLQLLLQEGIDAEREQDEEHGVKPDKRRMAIGAAQRTQNVLHHADMKGPTQVELEKMALKLLKRG